MRLKRAEFFFHETKNSIWFRLIDVATGLLIMEERMHIPWTTRQHADCIIEQLNLVLRSEQ